jgi:hypothetical protein
VAKRDCDSEGLRPAPRRDAIEIPDDLGKQTVRVQLLDCGFQQLARPRQLRRACGEIANRTRTQLRPPPIRIELMLRADGVFEIFVDVD